MSRSNHEHRENISPPPEDIEVEVLATEIMRHCQNSVLVSLRFLDAAFFKLSPTARNEGTLSTDGASLFYSPGYMLVIYSEDPRRATRDILHTVLHCIFRHLFLAQPVQPAFWDLACDIAVEAQIDELNLPTCACGRSLDQQAVLSRIKGELTLLSAPKIYRYLTDSGMTEAEAHKMRSMFFADDHSEWYFGDESESGDTSSSEEDQEDDASGNDEGETDSKSAGEEQSGGDPAPADEENPQDSEESVSATGQDNSSEDDTEKDIGDDDESDDGNSNTQDDQPSSDEDDKAHDAKHSLGSAFPPDEEQEWERISERMEVDLDTFSRSFGEAAGGFKRALKQLNREKYDYAQFLHRFAVMGEAMQINEDEFDYVFYTYGLNLYGNMPLVEPLEYQETHRVRDFVIAIDTSGSTNGALVESFLTKTYTMLKQTESFFSRVNIHIVQCDATVQEAVRISTAEEFERYRDDLEIRGMGGTDFRPVFSYVQECLNAGDLTNLGGLVYFTDGYGTFPEKQPPYKTAFVFLDNGGNEPDVPPWAIKLIMESEEL